MPCQNGCLKDEQEICLFWGENESDLGNVLWEGRPRLFTYAKYDS